MNPRKKPGTTDYHLRNIPNNLYREVQRLARERGLSVRAWIITLFAREVEEAQKSKEVTGDEVYERE